MKDRWSAAMNFGRDYTEIEKSQRMLKDRSYVGLACRRSSEYLLPRQSGALGLSKAKSEVHQQILSVVRRLLYTA